MPSELGLPDGLCRDEILRRLPEPPEAAIKWREQLAWSRRHSLGPLLEKLALFQNKEDLPVFEKWMQNLYFDSLAEKSFLHFLGRPNLTEELHSLYWNDPNLMPTNQRYLAAIHSADYLIANDSFRWFIATYPKDGPFLAQAYEAIGCPRCAQAIEDAMKKAWPAHGKQELNGYERLELEGEDFLRKEAALYSEESGKIDQRRRLFLLDNWQDFVSKEGNGNTKPID